jgi:hypothetical protein
LAKLRRARFGQSSEQMDSGQLPLTLEELKAAVAEAERAVATIETAEAAKGQPVRRKKLPAHFEHIDNLIAPAQCACPDCGGELKDLGEPDEAEVLNVKTVTFTVTRHIRPKKRCAKCSCIVQAPAPEADPTKVSTPRHVAMSWARRLKRVFGVEIERCTRCGGQLKIIASIEEPQLIAKILSHLERAAPEQSQSELALGARGPPAQPSLL